MTAVVNRTARLRWFVDCTKVLPFRRTHLGTSLSRAGWTINEEMYDQLVDLDDKKTAELIEPKRPIGAIRRICNLECCFVGELGCGVFQFRGVGVILEDRLEMFLKLERRFNLGDKTIQLEL